MIFKELVKNVFAWMHTEPAVRGNKKSSVGVTEWIQVVKVYYLREIPT